MRIAYLIAGITVALMTICNAPRIPFIEHQEGGPLGIFRGFVHGPIGFSWEVSWLLIVGGIYQLVLGIMYWDMDVAEAKRWQFTLETAGTAKLLWASGVVCLISGVLYAVFCFTHDMYLWPCGALSTATALISTWLLWLAFPLMEQVGIDREEFGI